MNQNLNDLETTYNMGRILHLLNIPYKLLENCDSWVLLHDEYVVTKSIYSILRK